MAQRRRQSIVIVADLGFLVALWLQGMMVLALADRRNTCAIKCFCNNLPPTGSYLERLAAVT